MTETLPPDYFERMFASDRDPWNLETSPYEADKYRHTVAALKDRRYETGLEVGCATGVQTERLGVRCRNLTAIDVSTSALTRAKARCALQSHIVFANMQFPKQAPHGQFDLIVLSEVAYYWSDDDLIDAAAFVGERLEPGGDVLLVHWIGDTDYPQTGDAAVTKLRQALPHLMLVTAERTAQYRLDMWRFS